MYVIPGIHKKPLSDLKAMARAKIAKQLKIKRWFGMKDANFSTKSLS